MPRNSYVPELTEREVDALRALAGGLTIEEAAAQLRVSSHTVKLHLKNAAAKLHARNRTHAVARAYDLGFLRPQEVGHG